ncbi:DinB family protein [Shivajiella indica]|uniref:DinB family protein n=1 Tax=Shivajiella indica TaxID=872115 RepID=A0ABW5B6M2_9BACT
MNLQNKENWIEKMETLVEEQLETSTKIFQNLAEEALIFSDSGNWSITACLDHLNSYAAFYLPRIKKVLESSKSEKDTSSIRLSWIGSYFINMMKPVENGKKFKAIKKHYPNVQNAAPYQIVAEFIDYLEEIQEILLKARGKDLNKGSISSSISSLVLLRPCDAIEFLLVHNQRHVIQAKYQLKAYQDLHPKKKEN